MTATKEEGSLLLTDMPGLESALLTTGRTACKQIAEAKRALWRSVREPQPTVHSAPLPRSHQAHKERSNLTPHLVAGGHQALECALLGLMLV